MVRTRRSCARAVGAGGAGAEGAPRARGAQELVEEQEEHKLSKGVEPLAREWRGAEACRLAHVGRAV